MLVSKNLVHQCPTLQSEDYAILPVCVKERDEEENKDEYKYYFTLICMERILTSSTLLPIVGEVCTTSFIKLEKKIEHYCPILDSH